MALILGEYTMEYSRYSPAEAETQEVVIQEYRESKDQAQVAGDQKGKKKKN